MDETTAACMNTSTAGLTEGPTRAQETTGAVGDANNGRDTKTGGHIGSRRDINNRRDAREVDSRKNHKTEGLTVGLATEFRSEKIPRNRLRMDSVIPRKKLLIPWAFRSSRKSSKLGTELNYTEKICFTKPPKSLSKMIFPYLKVVFF
jgi:hypothetical protein